MKRPCAIGGEKETTIIKVVDKGNNRNLYIYTSDGEIIDGRICETIDFIQEKQASIIAFAHKCPTAFTFRLDLKQYSTWVQNPYELEEGCDFIPYVA